MTRALYTIMAAVIVMFALPISQLRTVVVRVTCCCPDPAECHCPDHKTTQTDHDSMRACHKSSDPIASPTVPALTVPAIATTIIPAPIVASFAHDLTDPHESPSLERPRGPS